MPSIAYLECVRCHHHISAATPQALCPLCSGSLYVRYDMTKLKQTAKREETKARRLKEAIRLLIAGKPLGLK